MHAHVNYSHTKVDIEGGQLGRQQEVLNTESANYKLPKNGDS